MAQLLKALEAKPVDLNSHGVRRELTHASLSLTFTCVSRHEAHTHTHMHIHAHACTHTHTESIENYFLKN